MSQPIATKSAILLRRGSNATGPLLLLTSSVAFSAAGFFARSVQVDTVTMLFWRNLFGGLILLLFAFRYVRMPKIADRLRAAAIVALSAFGSICYIAAFAFTSVANISIIYAAAPMLTAALAWAALRERMGKRTLAAALAAFVGVALTSLGAGFARGSVAGDGLALLMTLALSAVAVLSRGRTLPPLTLSCASSLLATLAIAPARPILLLSARQFMWLAAFGVVTIAVAFPLYLLGLRSVAAGRAMLISAMELPLAPLWVWMAYGELPGGHAVVGGAIVCAAILWDLLARMRPWSPGIRSLEIRKSAELEILNDRDG